MSTKNKKQETPAKTPFVDSGKKTEVDKEVIAAHDEALSDIEEDPDLSLHSPNDDLDEGETARLGEDKTDLV